MFKAEFKKQLTRLISSNSYLKKTSNTFSDFGGDAFLLRKITAFTENASSQNHIKLRSLLLMCSPHDFKI